ncbi:MAG: phosphomannomutase/phosphoglucomutase [candidate division Zixibacteria bacterium]|nr:phosphomannomutase/phosphoglucomutase [candidate division Zixibacteria bacterium]
MQNVKKRTPTEPAVAPDIFKGYDIRGTVPEQLNPDAATRVGRAFARELKGGNVAVGRDMRMSSDELTEALVVGLLESGCDVVDLGRVSTDALYFAVGHLGTDGGVMVTASHNPPEYNGFKLCRRNAEPLSRADGIARMQEAIALGEWDASERTGKRSSRAILDEFRDHVLSFIDPGQLKKFTVVVDAGNGMAGVTVPMVFERLPCRLIPMYFDLDGRFPNHPANPIEPANLKDLQARVRAEKADFGVAFDGDADRMFLVDETGQPLGGDIVTLLVARGVLAKSPGAAILYNLICSRAVPEGIAAAGGRAVRTPVGHALIKPLMKRENALFGGEHSGHFYFQKNWYADSGLIALLVAMEILSHADMPLSELVRTIDPYKRSGEINSRVASVPKMLEKIASSLPDQIPDRTDGLTYNWHDWWFNVRGSNTEPLLRLNIEAKTADLLDEKTAWLLGIVRGRRKAVTRPGRKKEKTVVSGGEAVRGQTGRKNPIDRR